MDLKKEIKTNYWVLLIMSLTVAIFLSLDLWLETIFSGNFLIKYDRLTSDSRFSLRNLLSSKEYKSKHIALIVIDDPSLEVFGRWPWSRDFFRVLQEHILIPYKAKTITYDIVFAGEADAAGDRSWSQAIETADNVCLGGIFLFPQNKPISLTERRQWYQNWQPPEGQLLKFALSAEQIYGKGNPFYAMDVNLPLPIFMEKAAALGSVTVPPDKDGITRRVPLIIEYAGHFFPSLHLVSACVYAGVELSKIQVYFGKYIILPLKNGREIRIPIDKRGQMQLNFYSPELSVFSASDMVRVFKSLQQIIDGEKPHIDLNIYQGKLVIIGVTAEGQMDLRPVPISPSYPMVGTIATAVENILAQDFIYSVPIWINILLIFFGSLGLAFLGASLSPILLASLGLLTAGIYYAFSFWLFYRWGWWLNSLHIMLSLLITPLPIIIYDFIQEFRIKTHIRGVFARYLSPEIIDQLLSDRKALELGGKEQKVTIIFCDIVGFTPIATKLSPVEVVNLLNEFFNEMVKIIFQFKGTLDKFMGDALMATFGVPFAKPDDAIRAVKASWFMLQRVAKLREEWTAKGKPAIDVRIGINTGEVIVGNIGSKTRMEYSVIGDAVNVAERLENSPGENRIYISETTYEEVKEVIETQSLPPLWIKGKEDPLTVYKVTGIKEGNK